jgi:hypothetical protein
MLDSVAKTTPAAKSSEDRLEKSHLLSERVIRRVHRGSQGSNEAKAE